MRKYDTELEDSKANAI